MRSLNSTRGAESWKLDLWRTESGVGSAPRLCEEVALRRGVALELQRDAVGSPCRGDRHYNGIVALYFAHTDDATICSAIDLSMPAEQFEARNGLVEIV